MWPGVANREQTPLQQHQRLPSAKSGDARIRLTSFENDYAASFTAVPYTKSSEAVPTTPVVM